MFLRFKILFYVVFLSDFIIYVNRVSEINRRRFHQKNTYYLNNTNDSKMSQYESRLGSNRSKRPKSSYYNITRTGFTNFYIQNASTGDIKHQIGAVTKRQAKTSEGGFRLSKRLNLTEAHQSNQKENRSKKTLLTLKSIRETLTRFQNQNEVSKTNDTTRHRTENQFNYFRSNNSDHNNHTFYSSTTAGPRMRPISAKIGRHK